MKKAIITGFEKFGSYAVNPTEKLIKEIDGKIVSGHRIHGFVFPVGPLIGDKAVNYGRIIMLEAERINASVIVSLGVASQAKGVRIESWATNWVENDKYCSPGENRKRLDRYDLPNLNRWVPFNCWNFVAMRKGFQKHKIPFEAAISKNAGTFCCNALIYQVYKRIQESALGKRPFLMAHVPCTKEAVKNIPNFSGILIAQEQLKKVIKIMLESYA